MMCIARLDCVVHPLDLPEEAFRFGTLAEGGIQDQLLAAEKPAVGPGSRDGVSKNNLTLLPVEPLLGQLAPLVVPGEELDQVQGLHEGSDQYGALVPKTRRQESKARVDV